MLLTLVSEQIKQGLEPMILSAGDLDIRQKPIETEAEKLGLPLIKWRMTPGLNHSEIRKICKWADDWGVELVHSHGYKFNILMCLFGRFSRRVPLVSTVHGYVHAPRFSRMWIYELLDRFALKWVNSVVIVGEAMKRQLSLGTNRSGHFTTIRNGLALYETLCKANEPLPDNLTEFIDRHDPVILGVGRLSKEKGFDHLINCFQELKRFFPQAGLLIVGEGQEREGLEERIVQHGLEQDIFLPGYCENVPALMIRSSILVISSLTEGLPISLLEAMAVRLPIVSTSVGEIPYVLDGGSNGVLVIDPAKDLFKAIKITLSERELARQRTERAYQKVSNELSAKTMAKEYQRVYRRVTVS